MFSRGVVMAWVRKSEGVPVKAWDFLQLLVQEEVDIPTPSSAGRLLRGGDLLPQNYSSFGSNPKSSNLVSSIRWVLASSPPLTTLHSPVLS